MCTFRPFFLSALFFAAAVLVVGCDGFESGTTPDEVVEERETTVQFDRSGVGALPPVDSLPSIPGDSTVDVPVALSNPDDNTVSVEVLYAEQASTARLENVSTVTTLSFSNPGVEDTTLVESFEVDVSDVTGFLEEQKQVFFALQNLETTGSATLGEPRQFRVDLGPTPIIDAQSEFDSEGEVTVTVLGTVTRAVGAFARIQDESGPTGASGLVVRQTGDRSFNAAIGSGDIRPGTEVLVTGTLSSFNGLLQVNNDDLIDFLIFSQGEVPDPQVVTLEDLASNGGDYLSEFVRVEDLSFPDASGRFNNNQSYTVEGPDGNTLTFRVQGTDETNIGGTSIPSGTFTYVGVVGIFGSEIQLIPMESDDLLISE